MVALFACASSDSDAPPTLGTDAGGADASTLLDGAADAMADAPNDDDGDFAVPDSTVACAVTPCVTKLTGSADGYCAVTSDGRAQCWGSNFPAWLGVDPETTAVTKPSVVQGIAGITDLAMGGESTCARVTGGSVYCWGSLDLVQSGQVPPDGGDPAFGYTKTPMLVDAVPSAESISVGTGFACVRLVDGSLSCWGMNEHRELGRGVTDVSPAPPGKATLLGEPISAVVAAGARTFVITPKGDVLSWGSSTHFGGGNLLLGRDTSEDPSERPTRVPLLSRVRHVSSSFLHACAVAGRFVQCWGSNAAGQLGRGGFETLSYLPARTLLADVTDADDLDAGAPASPHDVPVEVVTGRNHSCTVLASGRVYCWGDSSVGRLLGSQVPARVTRGRPTRIDGFGGPVVALAAGISSTCALLRTGAVECWGANDVGQLGTGVTDVAPHPTPTRISFIP